MNKVADLNARRKLRELKQDPILGPVLAPLIESQLSDVEAQMSGVDPRLERTAEAIYETDLSIAKVQKSINEFFNDEGPEAA